MLKSLACFIFIAGLFSRMIFSRQATKGAKELFRRNLCVLCALARASLTAGYFSRQAAKIAKRIIPKESLRSLRLCERKKQHASDIIFLRD